MSTGKTPITLGRSKVIAAKRQFFEDTALAYQEHSASLDELERAATEYIDAKRAPLAKRTVQDHERKARIGT